jgi:hypothetical protein
MQDGLGPAVVSRVEMLVLVIFTSTSVWRSIFASGTFFTRTLRGPL